MLSHQATLSLLNQLLNLPPPFFSAFGSTSHTSAGASSEVEAVTRGTAPTSHSLAPIYSRLLGLVILISRLVRYHAIRVPRPLILTDMTMDFSRMTTSLDSSSEYLFLRRTTSWLLHSMLSLVFPGTFDPSKKKPRPGSLSTYKRATSSYEASIYTKG